jgi:hypothetical protein
MSLTTLFQRQTPAPEPEAPAPAPTCGARDGHGHTCSLDPHPEGTRHLDAGAGSRYHSVTWR